MIYIQDPASKSIHFISYGQTLLLDQVVDPECCRDKLKPRKDILRKYLNNDIMLELEALFALQEIYVKYNKPAGRL